MHDERLLTLFDADRRRLVRAAARLLGPADAEDAVQDAYVRALEADTLKLNAAQAWLLTVVRRLAIDRLRRRTWMQRWLAALNADDTARVLPSAETDAALAQEVARALHLLAARLPPADGAALLLHAVFEVDHAELANVGGRSEAGSRQQLRRSLSRLRQTGDTPARQRDTELDPGEEIVLQTYLQSLQLRDPQSLWAMLCQPAIRASTATASLTPALACGSAPPATACAVAQFGGQLGLVLTLDGVTLCVLPLGVRCASSTADRDPQFA